MLRNGSPVAAHRMTPYQALFARRPNVSRTHGFGSLTHMHIPGDLHKKDVLLYSGPFFKTSTVLINGVILIKRGMCGTVCSPSDILLWV